jgi:hypothetical protein
LVSLFLSPRVLAPARARARAALRPGVNEPTK